MDWVQDCFRRTPAGQRATLDAIWMELKQRVQDDFQAWKSLSIPSANLTLQEDEQGRALRLLQVPMGIRTSLLFLDNALLITRDSNQPEIRLRLQLFDGSGWMLTKDSQNGLQIWAISKLFLADTLFPPQSENKAEQTQYSTGSGYRLG